MGVSGFARNFRGYLPGPSSMLGVPLGGGIILFEDREGVV